ncbi:MAG: HD domain-containing protein [Clostridia bacterium]|nr:HD domain-containing protein [Clostridia bacterium]
MDYEQIEKYVKERLSEKRFIHSKGVAKRAVELARIYGEDEEKARLIGIAHDIAKEIPKEEALKYAIENEIEFDEIEKNEPGLWHSKIGADIVEKRFGFSKDMKQAVLYHTTGNVNMNTMDKIVYIADKTEENRTNRDLVIAREVSNQNLDKGLLLVAKRTIEYSLAKNSLIHPDTISLMNHIIMNNQNIN